MADISSNNTLNNQGVPPEVIDNTQESPSTITNPSGIILDENGKKTESHFTPNFDISQNLFNIFMTTHLFHKSYCKMTRLPDSVKSSTVKFNSELKSSNWL